ncbi:SDR family NAD(P)-dependent oxidoreductase [Micromonospora sp. WMMD729]|uniref:SDR family NAD(P)-dependent oxidoreductase n=1 Tax=Micromonospora sp. WMMD729 TaxID=3404127 RepID=UPI003BF5D554
MDLGIAGRVALVAGASSGLGRATARALAAEGCALSVGARDPGRLAEAARELRDAGAPDVLARPVDITDEAAVADWVAATVAHFGALHIVVANGGGAAVGTVDSFGLDAYRQALDAAFLPHVGLTLAALPHLRAAGWGRVLIVASETVRQPIPEYGLSSAVRPGLLGFTRALVQALGPGDITVNVLAPGYHDTEGVRAEHGSAADARLAEIGAGIPLGRVGRAGDFGAVAAFLASEAASFVTGTCLLVDGGKTRGIG